MPLDWAIAPLQKTNREIKTARIWRITGISYWNIVRISGDRFALCLRDIRDGLCKISTTISTVAAFFAGLFKLGIVGDSPSPLAN